MTDLRQDTRPVAGDAVPVRDLYYGGGWHRPLSGSYFPSHNPATGAVLASVAQASDADVGRAVEAAQAGFHIWKDVSPLERAAILRKIAQRARDHGDELVALDAADGGNPISELRGDIVGSAMLLDFFAGLVTEMKGASIPMGAGGLNFSVRQPYGVVARLLAFNHPFLFCAAKIAAPLAAGNSVIIKPSEQAPLSALRFAELIGDLLPPGVLNIVTGGPEAGAALATHPKVAKIALIGSVAAGRAVMQAASATLKPVLLELGGKNALIAFDDADPGEVADAMIRGMNFAWCGQSCGSTSRAYVHASIHGAVTRRVAELAKRFRPGDPSDPSTTMGAIVSDRQYTKVCEYISSAIDEGAELLCGGLPDRGAGAPDGFFIEPTIFAGVTEDMRITREEIFGPVLAILPWDDEAAMMQAVNGVDVGLTCSIWTNDLDRANRTAMAVEAGYVWVNETARHFLGAPFGGFKQSGIGREECLGELLAFTQEKNIYMRVR